MGRFQGRSSIACRKCHTQKLKCTGGNPCQRCQNRGHECVYPIKERLLTVPESYIRRLEAQANSALPGSHSLDQPRQNQQGPVQIIQPATASEKLEYQRLSDGGSAERFVQKIKELSSLTTVHDQPLSQANKPDSVTATRYTYAKLNFDCFHSEISIKLPPRPYAFYLLQIFEEGYCDYHWFLRSKFRERLALTYSDPQSQASDRNWLCRVSVVLDLAEAWNRGRGSFSCRETGLGGSGCTNVSDIEHGTTIHGASTFQEESPSSPPGSEFFEQCLLLLKLSLEEPTVEDVEALNLITFYSYSLNRRKTAFFYARQSISMAKLLSLDEPASFTTDPKQRIQDEHYKRIWWTCYCMDRMVSTELNIPPMQGAVSECLHYPDSNYLSLAEKEDFFEPYLLTAQVQLSIIKSKVVETVTRHLRSEVVLDIDNVLKTCTLLIQTWRDSLPDELSFTFDSGIPAAMLDLPYHRVLASLYLRYHQCIILLFRPFFLQELANTFRPDGISDQGGTSSSAQPCNKNSIGQINGQCLLAARNNCQILVDLWKIGKIAKFGYWEALHLFSGLAILSLSRLIASSSAGDTGIGVGDETSDATETYEDHALLFAQARKLLDDMARIGNLSAQDFKAMLVDVETMVQRVIDDRRRSRSQIQLYTRNLSITTGTEDYPGDPDGLLLDSILDEQIWYNIDWEHISSRVGLDMKLYK